MTFIKSIALIILVPLSAVSFGQTIDELVKKAESRKKISELEINKALIGAYSNHREAKKNKEQIKNSAVKIEPSRCFWTVTQTSFHKWQLQDITSERKDFIVTVDVNNPEQDEALLQFFKEWILRGYSLAKFEQSPVEPCEKHIRLLKVD